MAVKKALQIFLTVFVPLALLGCEKDCEVNDSRCAEMPPENEVCQAYFVRFFYDQETAQCKQRSYSGCQEYGFETRDDCLACSCNNP